MLHHPTYDRLIALGLTGMARALEEQRSQPDVSALTFEERLALLVDREATERQNRRLTNRLRSADLRQNAVVEDIDLKTARGLDRALFQNLVVSDWIDRKLNLIIVGPTGIGKSWIACALGHKACRDDRSVLYQRVPRLFDAIALARGDGRHHWHDTIGNPTVADAILDRLIHNAHRLQLSGPSMRKLKAIEAPAAAA
jgi:DNA replication protein DnaC